VGTYAGTYGSVRIHARQDLLIVALEGSELGPLQYQGGNTFIASWDHVTQVASGDGEVPVERFTVTHRKRVVIYRRGQEHPPSPPAGRHSPLGRARAISDRDPDLPGAR